MTHCSSLESVFVCRSYTGCCKKIGASWLTSTLGPTRRLYLRTWRSTFHATRILNPANVPKLRGGPDRKAVTLRVGPWPEKKHSNASQPGALLRDFTRHTFPNPPTYLRWPPTQHRLPPTPYFSELLARTFFLLSYLYIYIHISHFNAFQGSYEPPKRVFSAIYLPKHILSCLWIFNICTSIWHREDASNTCPGEPSQDSAWSPSPFREPSSDQGTRSLLGSGTTKKEAQQQERNGRSIVENSPARSKTSTNLTNPAKTTQFVKRLAPITFCLKLRNPAQLYTNQRPQESSTCRSLDWFSKHVRCFVSRKLRAWCQHSFFQSNYTFCSNNKNRFFPRVED